MNRNYPPPPPSPPQQMYRRPRQPSGPGDSPYAPARVLFGLINQSQHRYASLREFARKQDEGFGQLQIDAQNLSIALGRRDPNAESVIQAWLDAAMQIGEANKYNIQQLMQHELALQGVLKRWLTGQPPEMPYQPPPPQYAQQQQQQQPPQYQESGPVRYANPPQGAPQAVPGQGGSQGPQGASQGAPHAPQGPLDPAAFAEQLRDPQVAAAVLARAQQMPLGPVAGQPQVMPGVMPGVQYGPAQVPVQMQYAVQGQGRDPAECARWTVPVSGSRGGSGTSPSSASSASASADERSSQIIMSQGFSRSIVLEDGTTVDVRAVDERDVSRGRHEAGEVIVVFNDDYFLTCNWSDAARIANVLLEASKDAKYFAKK